MAKRKRKTKLEKLMSDSEEKIYETTQEDCDRWFRILNREIFNNQLYPVDEIDIRWRRKTFAYYEYHIDDKKPDYQYTKLCMNKRYRSKKFFVEVLAHEMVHHHQFIYGEPMGHGSSFMRWHHIFNKKGIKLVEQYDET